MMRKEHRRTLKAEATLLRIPIFSLAVKGSASLDGFEFRYARKRGDQTVEVTIRTERDADLPYPGPLSRRVHMAILSLVSERGFPFDNPVVWTWRDLCRRMGLPNSGRRDEEFKRAIRAAWGLKIFGLERLDGRVRESWRRLYAECEFQNDARADGSPVDANRLWLAPWYLDSLNALHAAPVDYELWKQFERVGPLASRLYEYLIPSFFKRECLELSYDRLASAMPVVSEARRSHAIRQFAPALEALAAEGIIARAEWDAMKGTGRPKLILARGPRLAPHELTPKTHPAGAEAAADPELLSRVVTEFYRLLGKEVRPVRSDQAVARDLIGRAGVERTLRLLPEAVRRLKSRFRNAETMGALVRYFDQVLDEDDRRQQAEERKALDTARRDAVLARERDEERRVAAAWAGMDEAEREAMRAAVLAEQPMLRRHPALLEAMCIDRVALARAPAGTEPREPAG
jgi:hypothetical protein